MQNNKRYAKYLRKSRTDIEAENNGAGETLAKHRIILDNLCKKLNITNEQIDTYEEIVSGDSIESRPVIQELLQLVEQNLYDGVLVVEVERLARGNTKDQGTIADTFSFSHTKIITPNKIYDPDNEFDQEYFEFGLFMSRREYKVINRRLQNGRTISATQGKFPASIAPYGYKRKKLINDKGWTLEVIPEQAIVIKTIFDLYAYKHMKPTDICRYLDKLGYKPLKSSEWSANSVRDILSNPIYIGKMRWKDRKVVKALKNGKVINTQPKNKGNDVVLVNGLHEPIIDDKTFNLVQEIKKDKTPPIPGVYNIQNPLSTLVRCAKCNRLMTRRSCDYGDIICCANSKCDNVSSKISLVEKKILEGLEIWLKEYEAEINNMQFKKTENNIIDIKQVSIKKIISDLDKCKEKMNRIYDFFENGVYSLDVFTERKNKILSEEIDLKNKYDELKKELDEFEKKQKAKKNLIPQTKNVLKNYDECTDIKMKNDLLKSVIEKVEYLKTEKCYKKSVNAENFELLIFPKF